MIIRNVKVYTNEQKLADGEIVIRHGVFGDSLVVSGVAAVPQDGEEIMD